MAREFGDDDAGPPFESASPPGTVSDTPSPARGVPPAGPAPVTESFAASEDDYVRDSDSIHDTVFADDDARPGVSEAFVDVSPAGRAFPPPGLSLTRARPGDGVECRICLMEDGDDFVSPCNCIGTLRHVHAGCLARWCRETGVTTLMRACHVGHALCVAILLHAGTPLDTKDVEGSTAIDWAVRGGHDDCVRLMREAVEAEEEAYLRC